MRSKFIYTICVLIFLTSCKEDVTKTTMSLGGKIVNPTTNQIVLYHKNKVIDTAYLNSQKEFSFNLDTLNDGLYEFKHDQESQIVHLEKGDSLLLRVNTLDFDESLSYTGSGSVKNNFLVSLFLQNDSIDSFIIDHINLEVTQFIEQAELWATMPNTLFKDIKNKHNFSNAYNRLAYKLIATNYNDLKERYFYTLKKHNLKKLEDLPVNFLAFRDTINFNDKDLEYTYNYIRYINNYLNNKYVTSCNLSTNNQNCFNNYTLASVSRRLQLLDSITTLPKVKDMFFDRIGKQGVILSNDTITSRKTITILEELGYTKAGLTELENLLIIQKIFYPNQNLGNTGIIDINKKRFRLKDVLDKTTVVYSWNTDSYMRQKRTQDRVAQLRNEYPNIDFIGITTSYKDFIKNPESINSWIKTLNDNNYNKAFEYHLLTSRILSALLKNFTNKVVIVDATGKILIGSTGLLSEELTEHLEHLSKS